ncbi:hypothetical protein GWD52_08830 [Enterobacteriaceae bacterium 4M9]|nr:hypothetical protein [Enterobacteriaceae bacterium 4M9]
MQWPIPDIPARNALHRPHMKLWLCIFCILIITGILLALFIGKVTTYTQALLYGALPAFLLWILAFSVAFYRYEQSVNRALLWQEETHKTKYNWQLWSMQQLAVVANVVLTPEKEGVLALLGKHADIPAYPKKARALALATELQSLSARLKFIDEQCEAHCAEYRCHLSSVKIVFLPGYIDELVSEVVYEIWDLYPEVVNSASELYSSYDDNIDSLILVLCLQDWHGEQNKAYSEFVTGQLITSAEFARKHSMSVLAGVGRELTTDNLQQGLDRLIEYNRLYYGQMQHIWLSGTNADCRAEFVQYATSKDWPLSNRMPCLSLDHSFGPPGPLMFPISIALLSDAAINTDKMQLLLSSNSQNQYTLCLITRDLFL